MQFCSKLYERVWISGMKNRHRKQSSLQFWRYRSSATETDYLFSLFSLLARYMTIFKATMFYFLPLTIIGILYSLMARKLQNSAREVQSIASSGCQVKNPQAQNRRHVARMVIVFILGLLSWNWINRPCFRERNKIFFLSNFLLFPVTLLNSFHHLFPTALDFSIVVLGVWRPRVLL